MPGYLGHVFSIVKAVATVMRVQWGWGCQAMGLSFPKRKQDRHRGAQRIGFTQCCFEVKLFKEKDLSFCSDLDILIAGMGLAW